MGALALALTVFLCDQIGVDNNIWTVAKNETIRIFAGAGVQVRWVDGDHQHTACTPPATGNHLVLVLADKAPKGWVTSEAMGFAPQNTNRAYVFYSYVQSFTRTFVMPDNPQKTMGTILGHTIAHELGHLLIPGDAHGNGIMRAQWTYTEWRQAFAGTLLFNPVHAQAMQARLRPK